MNVVAFWKMSAVVGCSLLLERVIYKRRKLLRVKSAGTGACLNIVLQNSLIHLIADEHRRRYDIRDYVALAFF